VVCDCGCQQNPQVNASRDGTSPIGIDGGQAMWRGELVEEPDRRKRRGYAGGGHKLFMWDEAVHVRMTRGRQGSSDEAGAELNNESTSTGAALRVACDVTAHEARQMKFAELREGVRAAYSRAAQHPGEQHDFPVGRAFAENVGYTHSLLDSMPPVAVDAFAGVSNVGMFAGIPAGSRVLDLGCGAGLDTLIAARRTEANGRVKAIDFSESMLDRARQAVKEAALQNVDVSIGDAEKLPVESGSIDVAIINGIFNLNPVRKAIFGELARVVRSNGRVYAAELILREPLPENERRDISNWFS